MSDDPIQYLKQTMGGVAEGTITPILLANTSSKYIIVGVQTDIEKGVPLFLQLNFQKPVAPPFRARSIYQEFMRWSEPANPSQWEYNSKAFFTTFLHGIDPEQGLFVLRGLAMVRQKKRLRQRCRAR